MSAATATRAIVQPVRHTRRWTASAVGGVFGGVILLFFLVCALFPQWIAHGNPYSLDIVNRLAPPGPQHVLGTDGLGRDLFTRIIYGTRYSLGVAVAIILIGVTFGTAYGMVAGYIGGAWDDVLMRIVDLFFSLPAFILAMAIAAAVGRGLGSLVLALTIVWWPGFARLVHGMVLGLRENPHIEGAKALGAPAVYIMARHIFPLITRELLVRATQDVGYALVAVASLSFIGLGAQPPTPEWGLLLGDARSYVVTSWWYPVFPGLAIGLATLGFVLVGDWLGRTSASTPQ